MKKRLTAWLLVFCMALSLLPGTAFAAENTGGGDDGKITIYYDLNDGGRSPYLLQMKTNPNEEPPINPGAIWAGRPFLGWAGDRGGNKAADISDGATLYAHWGNGYTVGININANNAEPPAADADYPSYETSHNGTLEERALQRINDEIAKIEGKNTSVFEGWYVAEAKGGYEVGDLFTKELTATTVIPVNGFKLYGKWDPIYQIEFDYEMNEKLKPLTSGQHNAPISTKKGGVLSEMPQTPRFKNNGYDFEAWYILVPDTTPAAELTGAEPITKGKLGEWAENNKKPYLKGVRIPHEELSTFSFSEIAKELEAAGVDKIELVANWKLPAGITFYANGGHFGSNKDDVEVIKKTDNDGKCIALPESDPTFEGETYSYEFLGWYREAAFDVPTDGTLSSTTPLKPNAKDYEVILGTIFTEPTRVYAAWEKKLTIKIDYGVGDKKSVYLFVKKGDRLDPKEYAQHLEAVMTPGAIPGWTVQNKWTVQEEGAAEAEMEIKEIKEHAFKKDAVIKAQLQRGYEVTFKIAGAADVTKYTDTYGYLAATEVPGYTPSVTPSPDGKRTFTGWSLTETGGSLLKTTTHGGVPCYGPFGPNQTTIYAQWGAPYTITLNTNGGNDSDLTSTSIKTDSDGKILMSSLPRLTTSPTDGPYKGYVHDGWCLDADGKNPVTADTVFSEPTTLYAKWVEEIKEISITYQVKVGNLITDDAHFTFTPSAEQEKTTLAGRYPDVLPNPTPKRDFVEFQGWYTNIDFTGTAMRGGEPIVKTPDGRVVLYAKWGSTARNAMQSRPASLARPSLAAGNPNNASTAAPLAASYKITFNECNDPNNPTKTDHPTTNGKLADLPDPTTKSDREEHGYIFAGWFTEQVDGTPVTKDATFYRDTEIYAHWEYVITFHPTEGSFADNALEKHAQTVGHKLLAKDRPADPARKGYTFAGWYTKASDPSTKVVWDSGDPPFREPTPLYARWELIKIAVTFDDGITGNTDYVAYTDKDGHVALPADPVRPGYTFGDWYTAPNGGGTKVTASTVFDETTTVYANWKKDIEITFDHNGGVGGPQVIKVKADGTLTKKPDPPKRAGYKFNNKWYTAPSGGTEFVDGGLKADATYYADWVESPATIKWDTEGNFRTDPNANPPVLAPNPETITKPDKTVNGCIPELPRLTRSGYRFKGWKVKSVGGDPAVNTVVTTTTPIYGDSIELKADWEDLANPPQPTTPVVTFIVDIDPVPDDAAHFTLETNSSYQLEQLPKLTGLGENDGWRLKDGTKVEEPWVYKDDTNVYVNIAQTHLITFDWNNAKDGGTSSTTTARTNSQGLIDADKWPDAQAKEKNPGYQFAGWYDKPGSDGKLVPKLTKFTGPQTIYAHWEGPFTITFDANGGKFPDGETTKGVETDEGGNLDPAKVTEKVPAPTREGYTKFGGWSTTKDGTEAVDPSAQPYTGAATLYAIWGPPYAITYDAAGGTVTPTDAQKMSTEDGKYPELPVPTHPRDSFGGWYTTKDYQEGTLATAGAACPGAVTLYAKWTREPPYTITFDANRPGATLEDPITGAEGSTITVSTDKTGVLPKPPADPKSRGDTFAGWFTAKEEGDSIGKQEELKSYKFTDDITLYAHWGTMDFTITFDYNLSQIMSDPLNITTTATAANGTLTYLPNSKLPQAASGDYEIEGWYKVPNPGKDDKPVTKGDIVHRDTTLYAKWKKADKLPIVFEYPNITFMDENGKPMITLEVEGYKMTQLPQLPYKEGYTATGWVTRAPDGTETPLTTDTQITGSVIAYPKYTEIEKTYTITFEPGEESELDPIKVTTTGEGRIPDSSMPADPQWEGHTFTGWYTSADGGTKVTRRTVFTQDTTVYAHWDKGGGSDEPGGPDDPNDPDNPNKPDSPTSPPFTITFNPNGGNLNANTTALTDLNGRLMALPTPARTGYHFDGWFNGNERITTATVFTANTTINAQWSTGSGGGSGGSGSGELNGYAVTVTNNSGGRVSVSTTYAREGDRVTVTVRPYSGYQLDRIDITNARGYDVDFREQGGNRYVFTMPASRVTVDAVFMELIANNGNGGNTGGGTGNNGGSGNMGGNTGGNTSWNPGGSGTVMQPSGGASSGMGIFSQPVLNTVPMPYLDVHPSDWYYSSVDYMWQRQLMGGVSTNRFGPQATTSNAMVWTILARLAGVDVTSGASVWYENARSWAVSNRISDGVAPNSPVTREQLATMLWNFKSSPSVGYDLGQFGDRGQISTYQAECALSWAVANNIVTGTANRLNPRGTATRAEVAAMITRFCQNT